MWRRPAARERANVDSGGNEVASFSTHYATGVMPTLAWNNGELLPDVRGLLEACSYEFVSKSADVTVDRVTLTVSSATGTVSYSTA